MAPEKNQRKEKTMYIIMILFKVLTVIVYQIEDRERQNTNAMPVRSCIWTVMGDQTLSVSMITLLGLFREM